MNLLGYFCVLVKHLDQVIHGQELVVYNPSLKQVILSVLALNFEAPLFSERYLLLLVKDALSVQREPVCEVLSECQSLFYDVFVLHEVVKANGLFQGMLVQ